MKVNLRTKKAAGIPGLFFLPCASFAIGVPGSRADTNGASSGWSIPRKRDGRILKSSKITADNPFAS